MPSSLADYTLQHSETQTTSCIAKLYKRIKNIKQTKSFQVLLDFIESLRFQQLFLPVQSHHSLQNWSKLYQP